MEGGLARRALRAEPAHRVEVAELDVRRAARAFSRDQNVLWLDVAVGDADAVAVRDGEQRLSHHLARLGERQPAAQLVRRVALLEDRLERDAVVVGEDAELVAADVEVDERDVHHVRVAQLLQHAHRAQQPVAHALAAVDVVERDAPAHERRAVDPPHAAREEARVLLALRLARPEVAQHELGAAGRHEARRRPQRAVGRARAPPPAHARRLEQLEHLELAQHEEHALVGQRRERAILVGRRGAVARRAQPRRAAPRRRGVGHQWRDAV